MAERPKASIAVIFTSMRNGEDAAGYAAAAAELDALVRTQPGFVRYESVRAPDGAGITVSYWADEASAIAWRDHAVHARFREDGRARWYASYDIAVARVTRTYCWPHD